MPAAHVCIDCKKDPPATVRKLWSRLKPGDAPRCGEHGRAFRDHTRQRKWNSAIRREFGIEPELYWAIYEAQGGRCAMPRCTAIGKVKMLAVEHDHEKAKRECGHDPSRGCRNCIRGLMCGPHNYDLLGKFRNSLQDALDYLADPPARKVIEEYVRNGAVSLPVETLRPEASTEERGRARV